MSDDIYESINSWSDFTLDHLLFAYRKAKFDAFHQRPFLNALAWAEFEQNVVANLTSLLRRLRRRPGATLRDALNVAPQVHPKKIVLGARPQDDLLVCSNEFERFRLFRSEANATAEVRIAGTFSPEAQVLSALWILVCGRALTEQLEPWAYANKVKKNYRLARLFFDYPREFQRWQSGGINTARKRLREHRERVAILSTDVSSFYHGVDPLFLKGDAFLDKVRWSRTSFQKTFTGHFVDAIDSLNRAWTKVYPSVNDLGVPIGLSASGVIANCILAPLDAELAALKPHWYGRYVDDIVIVLGGAEFSRLQDALEKQQPLLPMLAKKLFRESAGGTVLDADGTVGRSTLRIQSSKEKLFLLEPQSGLHVLDDIDREIRRASSEFRFGSDADAARALGTLTSAAEVGEPALSLRRASNLTVQRLKVSKFLVAITRNLSVLPASELAKDIDDFRALLRNHILTPLNFFDFFLYLGRFAGILAADGTQDSVLRVGVESTLSELVSVNVEWKVNGTKIVADLREKMRLARAVRSVALESIADARAAATSQKCLEADLAFFPWKLEHIPSKLPRIGQDAPNFAAFRRAVSTTKILKSVAAPALLFPTRPFLPLELSVSVPSAETDGAHAAVALIRGWSILSAFDKRYASDDEENPLLIVTSVETTVEAFKAAARGTPIETKARFQALERLFSSIVASWVVRKAKSPVVLLPELSIPRRFLLQFLGKFAANNISVIGGVEYSAKTERGQTHVMNQCVILMGDGNWWEWVARFQTKTEPAEGEKKDLGTVVFRGRKSARIQTYQTGGTRFGVLICSELLNIDRRAALRGKVDILFVPAWNPDLHTFDSLVNATSLDLHAFVAVSNNRLYGDSRVRAPAVQTWERDICQIRGGREDYFVCVTPRVDELNRQQLKRHDPESPMFKPVPDGFTWDK